MLARSIIALGVGLLLAVLVVRTAFVDAYGDEMPARASAAWPGHPSVNLASGLAEVGVAAAAGQQPNSETIQQMLSTSAKAPLAPEPYLVRGVEAQVEGDQALALRAFLAARQRDPRSVAARFFLADHYLKSGQVGPGLAELSALTRLVPQSQAGIAPHLAAFARMPGSLPQIRTLLRDQPQLEPLLLYELAAEPADSNLVISIWSGRLNEASRGWQQRLITSLVAAGRLEEARKVWSRFDPGIPTGGQLIDPKFEMRALPPFGWTLASGASGVAEPDGSGGLHILYYGRDDLVLANQLMTLKPGSYRLSMSVNGAQPAAQSLSWRVRCASSSLELASIALFPSKGNIAANSFVVPAQNCAAQQLELAGESPDLPEQADLTVSRLSLARTGQ
jgi:hypothetical protein